MNKIALAAMVVSCTIFVGTPAFAQTEVDEGSTNRVSNPEEIIVTGAAQLAQGQMKKQAAPEAIYSITSDTIAQKSPSLSALQLVSNMPGVNFGTSDAFGIAARNFIVVRGLDQTEIGWVLEGAPAVDPANYFPFTEAWADNENIGEITLMAGNSRLQDPIVTATGGEFVMSIRRPSDDLAFRTTASVGSFDAIRGFARVDTGELGASGLKAFVSYSYSANDNFVGPGRNKRHHVDFKAVKEWSAGSESSLFLSFSDTYNARTPPISLANFNIGKSSGDFEQFSFAETYNPVGSTNYYRTQALTRTAFYLSNQNKISLSDDVTLNVTPYFHYFYSRSFGSSSLNPLSIFNGTQRVDPVFQASDLQSGRLFVATTLQVREFAEGVNSFIEFNPTDTNHLMTGYWYDRWDMTTHSPMRILDATGNFDGPYLRSTSGQTIMGSNFSVSTDTNQFFIGDTQSLFDGKVEINAGLKYLIYHASGTNDAPGPQDGFNTTIKKTLPRVSISLRPVDQVQLYASLIRSVRMPVVSSTYANAYNVSTGGIATAGNLSILPETSWSRQIGVRYYGMFNVDVNAFSLKLNNRQVLGQQIINGVNTRTAISAGGQSIKGVAAEMSTKRYGGFALYGNIQYLDAKITDNIPSGSDFLPSKGKSMVLSPKWMGSGSIDYSSGSVFARATYKYVSSQYTTFVNDQKMPSYHTLDISLGYIFPDFGGLEKPTITASLSNLTKGKYLGISQNPTGNAAAVRGVNDSMIAAATPTYYLSAPFSAMVSLSTGF